MTSPRRKNIRGKLPYLST